MQKSCNRCGTDKPFSEFPRNAASPDGYYSLCKVCRAGWAKAYRAKPETRQREKERLREQYLLTKEHKEARRKARRAADPVRFAAIQKASAAKRKEYWNEWRREYYHRNKDMWRGIVARRRAAELGAGGSYGVADIRSMLAAQDGKCNCCRCELTKFEVDHIVPLSRGGTNEVSNLQLLCMPCNRSKADKLPHEFAVYRASFGLPQERARRNEGAQFLRGAVSGVKSTA